MTAAMPEAKGQLISLRELTPEDIDERYLSWFRDSVVTQFLTARNLTREDVIDYIEEGRRSGTYYMLALCDAASGLHVGNVKIGPIDRGNGNSDLVTVIGDRSFWGKGLATEAISLASQLAFEIYGIRKLCGSIISENVGSIKSYTRGGWHVECVRKHQYLIDGVLQDEVFVCCFNPKLAPPTAP
jgi:ribosomal-protein-alanine N-acetyltransferase